MRDLEGVEPSHSAAAAVTESTFPDGSGGLSAPVLFTSNWWLRREHGGAVEDALLLPCEWPNFWTAPDDSRLCRVFHVWISAFRGVIFQGISSGSGVLTHRCRGRNDHRDGGEWNIERFYHFFLHREEIEQQTICGASRFAVPTSPPVAPRRGVAWIGT